MNTHVMAITLATAFGITAVAPSAFAQSGRVTFVGTVAGMAEPQYGPQYPNRGYPYPDRGGYRRDDYAFSNGYREGYEKGIDDARDRDRYDPRRHRKYRNGDSGYRRDYYGRRDEYRDSYRRGFANGYDAGYRSWQRGYDGPGRPGPYPPQRRDRGPRGGFWFQW